jgi:hypothetical protein
LICLLGLANELLHILALSITMKLRQRGTVQVERSVWLTLLEVRATSQDKQPSIRHLVIGVLV